MRPPIVAALLALALPGCGAVFGPGELGRLEDARRLWARSGVTDYEITVFRGCFCGYVYPAGVRVVVGAGEVESRTDRATGEPIPGEAEPFYPGVTGLFDLIEETIRRHPDEMKVVYDSRYGYPRSFQVDPIRNAIDDELGYQISGFRAR